MPTATRLQEPALRPLRADAARNRELLLRAAEEVFSTLGLEAGVEEVARRAGVGMGTLYRRFPTKEALVNELAQALFDELSLSASAAIAAADGTAVETFLAAMGDQFTRHGGLLTRLWCVPRHSGEVAEFRSRIAALVAADQAAGTLRPEVAGADVSVLLWGVQGVVASSGSQTAATVRRYIDLSLAALSTGSRTLTSVPLSHRQLEQMQRDRVGPAIR